MATAMLMNEAKHASAWAAGTSCGGCKMQKKFRRLTSEPAIVLNARPPPTKRDAVAGIKRRVRDLSKDGSVN